MRSFFLSSYFKVNVGTTPWFLLSILCSAICRNSIVDLNMGLLDLLIVGDTEAEHYSLFTFTRKLINAIEQLSSLSIIQQMTRGLYIYRRTRSFWLSFSSPTTRTYPQRTVTYQTEWSVFAYAVRFTYYVSDYICLCHQNIPHPDPYRYIASYVDLFKDFN